MSATLTHFLPHGQPPSECSLRVVELHPDLFAPAPGNREVTLDSIVDLLESIRSMGQQVPGISYPDRDNPGKYLVADGNRRLLCDRVLQRMFRTILLEAEPSRKELRRIRVTTSNIRKAMTPAQVADEIEAHIAEEGCAQDEAAEFFGLSKGYVSKLLSPSKRLAPDLQTLRDNPVIVRDVLRLISTLRDHDAQRSVAQKIIAAGGLKRSAVEGLPEFGGKGKHKRQPPLEHRVKDGGGVVTCPGDWPTERVAEWLAALAKKAKRCAEQKLPPVAIAQM